MKTLRYVSISTMVVLACVTASAQMKTLRWSAQFCQYSGTYDAKKYTVVQLRNTLKLAMPNDYDIGTESTAFSYQDIARLSVAKLDAEYKTKTSALKALDIVKTPYWEDMRARKLAEMRQVYELSRSSRTRRRLPVDAGAHRVGRSARAPA